MEKAGKQGILIALEGMDGAGKTTAAREAVRLLQNLGMKVMLTREPGGSPVAEQIRQLLLNPANTAITPEAEALLYAAARAQHVQETIMPAVREGYIVLCDRFLDSSLVYQGIARGLGVDQVETLNDFGLHGFRPDLTLFYKVDPVTGLQRIAARGNENRLDLEQSSFHQKVSQGFLKLLEQYPERFVQIDASGTPEEVAQETCRIILEAWKHQQEKLPDE